MLSIAPSPQKANRGQFHTKVSKDINEGEEKIEGDKLGSIYHDNLPGLVWKTFLLTHSVSSMDIFNNAELLTNDHRANKPLKLHCNTSCIKITHKPLVGGIEVWYHAKELLIFYH